MRYLTKDDYRMLQAIEMGMRNHELVPVSMIARIAKLRHGGSHKILSTLLRYKLIAHENQSFDGYRLSYQGYDILALRTLLARNVIASVGAQVGIGKESDVYEAQDEHGNELVLKIHRLGRTSFRAVRSKRDYMAGKGRSNWLYMSRLAALKEFAFMQALYAHGFCTPIPIEHNRHVVAMSKVEGFTMAQIKSGSMEGAEEIFDLSMDILRRLAQCGLVHCDFNEFNLMISPERVVTLIDFPQMVSTNHPNAEELFQRDKNGLIKFFALKMHYIPPDEATELTLADIPIVEANIDMEVRAAGFSIEENDDLAAFVARNNLEGGVEEDEASGDEDEDDDVASQGADDGAIGNAEVKANPDTVFGGFTEKVASNADDNDKDDGDAPSSDDDDDISELGDEDPDDVAFIVGQKPKVLLEGTDLEQARRDAKFKVAKKGGRFSAGKKGGNVTKKINKYGHRVKTEKMSDMIM
jgi:RIO kinase 2